MATRIETFAAALAAELAPSPERIRATARIVVACLVATTLWLGFHVPEGHWAIVTIFTVSQSDAGASLTRGLQRVVATIVGGIIGILIVTLFADQPWISVPLLGTLGGAGIFFSRTTTAPYVGLLAALTGLLIASVAHGSDPSAALAVGLWRILLISLGVVIATAAQLLLWPTDPETLLHDLLAGRFEASARIVRGMLTAGNAAADLANEEFVRRGLLHQLDLIRASEARHPSLRHRHVEQLALIGAAEHLLTAAAAVARLAPDPSSLGAPARERLTRVASQSESLAAALCGRAESTPPAAARDIADEAVATAGGTALLGGLLEMERSLAQASSALSPSAANTPASVAAVHFDVPEDGSFFTPAFSARNGPELAFALKAGIAVAICVIIVNGLAWPGIDTAIWTTVLVAQSSVGAIVQKSILRLAGAALGGLLALTTTVLVVPNGETLASMLLAVGAGATVAAWMNTGSARIAYAGMQTGLAFGLTIIDSFRPTVNLTVPRDRVLGIFLGIVVTGLVFAVSGHRLARDALRGALAKALRALAELAQVGIGAMDPIATADPVRGHRWSVYTALAETLALDEEARYEAGAQRGEILALRAGVLAAANRALGAMLALLAVVRHRLDIAVRPDAVLHQRVRALALGIVATLEALADRLEGRASAALPDLTSLLSAVESTPRDPAAIHLHARLALYRALVEVLDALVRDVERVVDVSSAAPPPPPNP